MDEVKFSHKNYSNITNGSILITFFMFILSIILSILSQLNIDKGFNDYLGYYYMVTGILFALSLFSAGRDETRFALKNMNSSILDAISLGNKNLENKIDNIQNSFDDIKKIADKGDINEIKRNILEINENISELKEKIKN